MTDFVIEETIKRDNGTFGKILPICTYLAFIIFCIVFNVFPMLLGLNIIYVTGMLSFGLWFLVRKFNRSTLNVEYEISIVNDQFTLTSITDGKKRSELADFSIRDCDYIGPVTKDRFENDKEKSTFTLNATANRELHLEDDVWYLFVNGGNYRYIIAIDFNDEMYPVFRRYNPRGTEFVNIKKVEEPSDSIEE